MPARRQNSEMLSNNPTAACAIAGAPWGGFARFLCDHRERARWDGNHKGAAGRSGTISHNHLR